MEFLFKHIKDNIFSISEGYDDVNRHISKIEEDQAFQYIKRILIPLAVNSWNRLCKKSRICKNCIINSEQISKTLKKVERVHFVPNDKTTTDIIRYEADFLVGNNQKLNGPFKFEIYKQITDGKLLASWTIPGSQMPTHYEIGEPVNENINAGSPITKMEEQQALQVIRSQLIPRAVESWNKYKPNHYPTITEEEIRKNIKKKLVGKYNNFLDTFYITYQFGVIKKNENGENRPIIINFFINKKVGKNDIFVNYNDLFSTLGDEKIPINESTEKELDIPISKLEEQQSFDFIKKVLVPIALNHYKKYTGHHGFESVSLDDILKNLKKVDVDFPPIKPPSIAIHSPYDPQIFYEAQINDKSWKFTIRKSLTNGKMYATWAHPWNFGGKFYPVGEPIIEGSIKIINRPIQAKKLISKIEEDEAFQYIKNHLVPWAFEQQNMYQIDNYKLKSLKDISLHLKKISIRYDPIDKEEIIKYEAPHPIVDGDVFRFFITKKENNRIVIQYQNSDRSRFWFNVGKLPVYPGPRNYE